MQTTTSADGTRLAFERSGDGPVVVIVNGGLADRAAGAGVAERLEHDFSVVRYDRRGRGGSSDTPPYAPRREVEDLAAIIAANGERAHVYGHSSGAVLALHAAANGVAIDRLALYEPPFVATADAPRMPPGVTADLRDLLAAGDAAGAVTYFLRESVGLPPAVVDQIRAHDPNFPQMVAMAATLPYETMLVGDQRIPQPVVDSVHAHTLVLAGGDSVSWMQQSARALADALPRGDVAILDGQQHGVEPDAVAPVLARFFRGDA